MLGGKVPGLRSPLLHTTINTSPERHSHFAENGYTGSSVSPSFSAIAAQPRPCAILASRLAVRDQVGRFPGAALFRQEGVRLVSRNGNTLKSFPALCEGLARDLKGCRCVLDGEIVCLDPHQAAIL